MDERVIFEKGVVRMTRNQLARLYVNALVVCEDPDALIDIEQPREFNDVVDFSIFGNVNDK